MQLAHHSSVTLHPSVGRNGSEPHHQTDEPAPKYTKRFIADSASDRRNERRRAQLALWQARLPIESGLQILAAVDVDEMDQQPSNARLLDQLTPNKNVIHAMRRHSLSSTVNPTSNSGVLSAVLLRLFIQNQGFMLRFYHSQLEVPFDYPSSSTP